MIAHNAEVGEFSMIIGQAGVASSAKIGKGVIMAGQSAVSHGLRVGDGVKVAGQAGLTRHTPAGAIMGGTPAVPIREALAQKRVFKTFAKFKERMKELESDIKELKEKFNS